MSPDEQEAKSFAALAFPVLPLGSGKIAVYDSRKRFLAIVFTLGEAREVYENSKPKQPEPQSKLAINLGDLL